LYEETKKIDRAIDPENATRSNLSTFRWAGVSYFDAVGVRCREGETAMSETTGTGQEQGAFGKLGLVLLGAGVTALAWVVWAAQGQDAPVPPEAPPGALAPPWRDEAVPQAIRQVLADQDAAWNRGDLEGFMAGYLRSPQLTFSSAAEPRRGWQETLGRYRQRYQGKGNEMGKLTFSDLDIRLLRADLALVTGRWKLVRTKDAPDGLFTLVMWRTPDGWRIIHDHTSVREVPAAKKAES
jgi:beta-aspartyl-peptidase (threonine type)